MEKKVNGMSNQTVTLFPKKHHFFLETNLYISEKALLFKSVQIISGNLFIRINSINIDI